MPWLIGWLSMGFQFKILSKLNTRHQSRYCNGAHFLS